MQRYTTNYIVCCTLSGDVDQIFNTSGNLVARYIYDTWGNTVSVTDASGNAITSTTHIANINPIRYRGYYWDKETRLYYLQSRYYDTVAWRFINADELLGLNGEGARYNLFAYCGNNPVNSMDSAGTYPIEVDDDPVNHRIPKGYINFSKKATNRPDSGLIGVSDEEVQRKARDKSLSGVERKRYQQEEKVRGLRNKQKRASNITPERVAQVALGVGIVAFAAAGIFVVVVVDVTIIGTIDDLLLVPLGAGIGEGAILIFAG